ncbi:siderophore ABC transporter substrate-binding protein [Halomonas elongata]|uniref:siderophore ABC transporter substrate-binding protein n=1 Tax=Halomonas elongata TaxID=2746 RepID=UPI00255A8871|nr:siderophore ABC transporter substrate-binding protein [Halomonas elongata]MDL4860826.1 siderophore ABC transporter substrate-binding protein [Halomonas elongata]
MIENIKSGGRAAALAVAMLSLAPGVAQAGKDEEHTDPSGAFSPMTIEHSLGKTVIEERPERVAVLDMNELDFLDQLGVEVAGAPKDFVPDFLSQYKNDPDVMDLGFIVKPNIEKVYELHPDLVLMTSLQANHYDEISQFSPVLHFDVDYRNSQSGYIEVIRDHLMTLGRIFGEQELAREKGEELEEKAEEVRNVTEGRPEKALVVMHNNGTFASFGVNSRYGFVFDTLGVKPANTSPETGLHGQPISSEFIQESDPDILFVIDRTAVMEHRPVLNAESLANPLLRETKAWKNDRVIFVDPEAWYVTGASITPLNIIMDDVLKAYRG